MNAISVTGVVRNGQVVLDGPLDLPDGARVQVVGEVTHNVPDVRSPIVAARLANIRFMSEEEQGDDPASIEKWIAELNAIPPIPRDEPIDPEVEAWNAWIREMDPDTLIKTLMKQPGEGRP